MGPARQIELIEKLCVQSSSKRLQELDWEDDTKQAEELLKGKFSSEQEYKDMVRRLSLSFGQIRGNKKLRETIEQVKILKIFLYLAYF